MRRVSSWLTAKLVPLMGIAMLTLAIAAAVAQSRPVPALRAADPASLEAAQAATLDALQHAFIRIADRVEPAVVTIDAVEKNEPEAGAHPPPSQSIPSAERLPGEMSPESAPGDEGESSGGSGIIVREEGGSAYVLT